MPDPEIPEEVLASGVWTQQIGPQVVGSAEGYHIGGTVRLCVYPNNNSNTTYVWYGINNHSPDTELPNRQVVTVTSSGDINYRYSVPIGSDIKFVMGPA